MRMEFANASRQFAATTLVDDLLVPATGGGDAQYGCPLNNARFQNRTVRYRPTPDVYQPHFIPRWRTHVESTAVGRFSAADIAAERVTSAPSDE